MPCTPGLGELARADDGLADRELRIADEQLDARDRRLLDDVRRHQSDERAVVAQRDVADPLADSASRNGAVREVGVGAAVLAFGGSGSRDGHLEGDRDQDETDDGRGSDGNDETSASLLAGAVRAHVPEERSAVVNARESERMGCAVPLYWSSGREFRGFRREAGHVGPIAGRTGT